MFVGMGYVKIRIYDAYSLKDRRQVLQSLTKKFQNSFGVSVCVLDPGDLWNIGEIGLAFVSSSLRVVEETFQRMESFCHDDFRFEVLAFRLEVDTMEQTP